MAVLSEAIFNLACSRVVILGADIGLYRRILFKKLYAPELLNTLNSSLIPMIYIMRRKLSTDCETLQSLRMILSLLWAVRVQTTRRTVIRFCDTQRTAQA